MSAMVEKVARAIYDKSTTFDGDQIAVHLGNSCIIDMSSRNSEELTENVMSVCRDAARAAIEAMRLYIDEVPLTKLERTSETDPKMVWAMSADSQRRSILRHLSAELLKEEAQ